MVPDTTQARLSHDTMRKWAYTGAQTCANRKTQEQTGDKSFMQGGFTRGTAGVGTEGKGHQNARQAQEGLVAPKGSFGAVPQSSVGETRPSSLHSHGLHTPRKGIRSGARQGCKSRKCSKRNTSAGNTPSPWDESTFSPEPSRVMKGATTRSLNPHSNLGRNCKLTQH